MKILLVADEESPRFWDYYQPGMLKDIDLMLSCGDLKSDYLTFLVTMGRAPLLYVHGNHDGRYKSRPPEGCDCIDGRLVTVKGIRILGLGGSRRYNNGEHQYTERQMLARVVRLQPQLLLHGGPDIILTHAPAAGLGDGEDLPHQGFEVFLRLLDRHRPRHLIHGPPHLRYGRNIPRLMKYGDTTVINACGYYILDYPTPTGA